MSGEFSAVIATDMIGRTMALEQIGQHGEHIVALQLALDMDRQALAAVFVDHCQHAEGLPAMGTIHDEVIAPHMAAVLRTQPHA